jgi:hypothetical protein
MNKAEITGGDWKRERMTLELTGPLIDRCLGRDRERAGSDRIALSFDDPNLFPILQRLKELWEQQEQA